MVNVALRKYFARTLAQVQGTSLYRYIAHSRKPAYVIREASGKDLEYGIAVLYGSGEKGVPRSDQSVVNCIIQSRDRTVGHGQLVHRPEKSGCFAGFWIHGVYIRPLYRRRGLGEELIRELIRHAHQRGAAEILIQVFLANRPAVRMYERAGFTPVHEYSPGLTKHLDTLLHTSGKRAIIMRLPLSSPVPDT